MTFIKEATRINTKVQFTTRCKTLNELCKNFMYNGANWGNVSPLYEQVFHCWYIVMLTYMLSSDTNFHHMLFILYLSTGTQSLFYWQTPSASSVPAALLNREGVSTDTKPCPWDSFTFINFYLRHVYLMHWKIRVYSVVKFYSIRFWGYYL